MSLLIPGHHTEILALSLHFVKPWWPVWSWRNTSSLCEPGITILSSYSKSLSISERWALASWNPCSVCVNWDVWLGHPWQMYLQTSWRFESYCVASLIAFNLSPLTDLVDSTACTNTVLSHSVSDSPRRVSRFLERASATTSCLPGTCTALTLNLIKRIRCYWHLKGALSTSYVFIKGTSGLWSVWSSNLSTPCKYCENHSHAHGTCSHSLWAFNNIGPETDILSFSFWTG